jgi:cell division septum initiation protein DivIVA
MPVLLPSAAPIHEAARLRILEAYIEALKAENESLKRQLADAEKRSAREIARAEGAIAEFSAIARRLTARTTERAMADEARLGRLRSVFRSASPDL